MDRLSIFFVSTIYKTLQAVYSIELKIDLKYQTTFDIHK